MTDPQEQRRRLTFAGWMGSMWLYTVLRFGLFFALWGLLVLAGLRGYIAAVLAIVLSVPLSYVLLARPRARFAANIEQRINSHREDRAALDKRLSGEDLD
jgi:O-antigen ligase